MGLILAALQKTLTASGSINTDTCQARCPARPVLSLPCRKTWGPKRSGWQIQRERLAASAFYQRHHRGAPLRLPATLEGIAELPFTDKEDLRKDQATYPLWQLPGGFAERDAAASPLRHYRAGDEPRALAHDAKLQAGAGRAQSAGLGPDDTVVHCLNYQLWMGGDRSPWP